ncbi:MAG: peptidoglycan-binding protein [Alphaproteobacteria bacterium]|nr:peptidoglycan-binding protein [Alphaproteobacteria bacterium]
MKIELSKLFASDSIVDEDDVRQIKKALNRLGYYRPNKKTGITGISDAEIFEAIKVFQESQGLLPTGVVRPDDDTMKAINREIAGKQEGLYIWHTVGDEKVRPEHAVLNRTLRNWKDSPDPGDDFNCRCWAEVVDDGIKPFYPELLLIPLLRIGKLYTLWRIWTDNRNTNWTLGKHKSPTRWGNQLKNRDWTPEQITKTIKNGKRHKAPNKVNPENTATRYEYRGRFVVQDDQTKEILQISGRGNFKPNILGD